MSKKFEISEGEAMSDEASGQSVPEKFVSAEKEKKGIVTFQFEKRFYQYVTPIEDPSGTRTQTGIALRYVIKVRDWHLRLDTANEIDKKVCDYLRKSDRLGIDFWEVTEQGANAKVGEKATTLGKLLEMKTEQLRAMLSAEELLSAGVLPNTTDRSELITVILEKKKIIK